MQGQNDPGSHEWVWLFLGVRGVDRTLSPTGVHGRSSEAPLPTCLLRPFPPNAEGMCRLISVSEVRPGSEDPSFLLDIAISPGDQSEGSRSRASSSSPGQRGGGGPESGWPRQWGRLTRGCLSAWGRGGRE